MALSILTADQDGSNPVHTSRLGQVTDLRWSHGIPRGCLTASWTLDLPAGVTPVGLHPGRLVSIYDGPIRVWVGTLDDAEQGHPWQISASGIAALGDRYVAVDVSGIPTIDPNVAIDQAISRGLPWTRPATLPTPTITQSAPGSIGQLLDDVQTASGQRWQVNANAQVSITADPTTPDYLLVNVSTPGGRTIAENYATKVFARYLSSGSTPPTPAIVTVATQTPNGSGPKGTYEVIADITDRGPINTTVAVNILAGALTLQGPRAAFTGQIPVQPGSLLTPGGVPVRLSTVTAGQLIRCIGDEPDPAYGELNFSTVIDVLISESDYDATEDLLTLTPIGFVPRDFASVLEDSLGKAR
jgi:hypothetical protein